MFLIIIGALIGNILVILSILMFWKLRQSITNLFILSLAFADLLVAIIVMPFNAISTINYGRWILGRVMCDIFNSNDVLFSTASIIHLVCISFDRYIAIVYPFLYESIITRVRAYLMIAVTWILSILISYIPILTGIYTTEEHLKTMKERSDVCSFVTNPTYALISSCVSFWMPCITLCSLYRRVYHEANRQEGKLLKHIPHRPEVPTTSHTNQNPWAARNERFRRLYSIIADVDSNKPFHLKVYATRERRAAKILGLVLGCFILCWLPFFTWYTTINICGQKHCYTPEMLIDFLFWCGYVNSLANPLIYSYCNKEFRKAFSHLLQSCTKGRRRPVRWSFESNICYTPNATNTHRSISQRRASRIRTNLRMQDSELSINCQGDLPLRMVQPKVTETNDS